jgi:hypothetical protein
MRNRVINGGMVVDFRNTGTQSSSGIGAVAYAIDRWYVFATTAAVLAQRVASSSSLFSNVLRITGGAGNAGVSVGQRIEVQNSYDMAGRAVTLSFYAASSASVTLTWKLFYAGAANDFTSKTQSNTGTQATTATLTKYSATFTLPAAATTGVAIEIGTASAFTSGTFDLTGIQLELGAAATPFERRSYATEIQLCQRYYERGDAKIGGYNTAGSEVSYAIPFKVPKRAVPTLGYSSSSLVNVSTWDFRSATNDSAVWYSTATATGSTLSAGAWSASSEL